MRKTLVSRGAYGWTAETIDGTISYLTMKRYKQGILTTRTEYAKVSERDGVRVSSEPILKEFGHYTSHAKATKNEIERIHCANLKRWSAELSLLEMLTAKMKHAVQLQDEMAKSGEIVRII